MGASNCPETPRQKMIGMMYLVLNAMLALNVSKDILDAFVVVDETLEQSNRNIEASTATDYNFLDQQFTLFGEEKIGPVLGQAKELKKASEEIIAYVDQLKVDLLEAVDGSYLTEEGQPKTAKDIESKDDYTSPSNFFITEGRATQLKDKVGEYREFALKFIPETYRSHYDQTIGLNINGPFYDKDGKEESWEQHNFSGIITIACFTLLNKLVGEVRNVESTVLKNLISSIGADSYKFDVVEGRAIPQTRMVFANEGYEADIIVAAYDSKSQPEVYYKTGIDSLSVDQIPTATRLDGEDGMAKLKITGGGLGDHKYAGLIKILQPDGQPAYYSFSDKYTVIQPSATVAAEKMNVLYSGIENPLSAAGPVSPDKLSLSIPGCNVARSGGGKFNVTVPTSLNGRQVTATVSADMGGKSQPMGSTVFRVKAVPTPQPYVGANIQGGRRSKAELTANAFLKADMGTDFVYDLRWSITSYRVIFTVRGFEETPIPISGPRFSDELIRKINAAPAGAVITFTDIKASSSAGQRNLPEISVRIR